jgi:hypothetical protein
MKPSTIRAALVAIGAELGVTLFWFAFVKLALR